VLGTRRKVSGLIIFLCCTKFQTLSQRNHFLWKWKNLLPFWNCMMQSLHWQVFFLCILEHFCHSFICNVDTVVPVIIIIIIIIIIITVLLLLLPSS